MRNKDVNLFFSHVFLRFQRKVSQKKSLIRVQKTEKKLRLLFFINDFENFSSRINIFFNAKRKWKIFRGNLIDRNKKQSYNT